MEWCNAGCAFLDEEEVSGCERGWEMGHTEQAESSQSQAKRSERGGRSPKGRRRVGLGLGEGSTSTATTLLLISSANATNYTPASKVVFVG